MPAGIEKMADNAPPASASSIVIVEATRARRESQKEDKTRKAPIDDQKRWIPSRRWTCWTRILCTDKRVGLRRDLILNGRRRSVLTMNGGGSFVEALRAARPEVDTRADIVIDNTACLPGAGGSRTLRWHGTNSSTCLARRVMVIPTIRIQAVWRKHDSHKCEGNCESGARNPDLENRIRFAPGHDAVVQRTGLTYR